MLTIERLKHLLHYDPDTGVFTHRVARKRVVVGEEAGHVDASHGYRTICIDYKKYYAHRLAIFYMTGEWPTKLVDHWDTNRLNNRYKNLRDASRLVNQQNLRKANTDNSSGLLGAHKKRGKWSSQIRVSGKVIRLGSFDTAEQAHEAYVSAKRELHVGCTL
jgi:hypothetical protein